MRRNNEEYSISDELIKAKIEEARSRGFTQDKLALAYARVSTKRSEQELSKENQAKDCVEYAEKTGLFLIYTFECTESAKKQGRKVFNAMLQLALIFDIKNIIMKDTSRLARNLGDKDRINTLVNDEKRLVIHFYMRNEILDHNSQMLMTDIFAVIDANFSANIADKSRYVYQKKKENGIPFQLPMGLHFNEKDKSKVEIDPNSEHIIRELFDLFIGKKYTLERIAKYFNSMGYKTRQGNEFYESTVHRMILNKLYTGRSYWVKDEGYKPLAHPFVGYITEEQYDDEIEKTLKRRSTGNKRRKVKPYLLTSFILCAKCDRIASGNRPDHEFVYYSHKCKHPDKYIKPYWSEKTLLEKINNQVIEMTYNEEYTGILKITIEKAPEGKK